MFHLDQDFNHSFGWGHYWIKFTSLPFTTLESRSVCKGRKSQNSLFLRMQVEVFCPMLVWSHPLDAVPALELHSDFVLQDTLTCLPHFPEPD